jgi:ketosteroid isomerase-like protein
MSANVDLVRSIYAAWARGDYRSTQWADAEIEYVWADGPSPGVTKGLAAMSETNREFMSAWKNLRIVAEEFRELDGNRVLALHTFRGHGKTSGLEVGQTGAVGAIVFYIERGKVTKELAYLDGNRALADLGLTE